MTFSNKSMFDCHTLLCEPLSFMLYLIDGECIRSQKVRLLESPLCTDLTYSLPHVIGKGVTCGFTICVVPFSNVYESNFFFLDVD